MNKTSSRALSSWLALAALVLASPAFAGDGLSGSPSEKVSVGAMSIVGSPVASAQGLSQGGSGIVEGSALGAAGSVYVVAGIAEGVGDTVEIMLSAVGSSAKASVRLSSKAAGVASLAVGTTVKAVADGSGVLLVASGTVVAFIPNAIGEALFYQAPLAR